MMDTEVHHLTDCSTRLGHDATIPLCVWHHRGEPPEGTTKAEARITFGPSFADGRRPFAAAFGSDQQLLELTNAMLDRKWITK